MDGYAILTESEVAKVALCVQCNSRPRPKGNSRLTCVPCSRAMQLESREEEELKAQRRANSLSNYSKYWLVLHWKGELLGVINDDPDDYMHKVTVLYIRSVSNLKGIPKGKIIDLDVWQPGYDRNQIRAMKRHFYSLVPSFQIRKRLVEADGTPISRAAGRS